MALTKYKLGELIGLAEKRNSEKKYTIACVKGIATSKEFIATKADMEAVELHNYKVVLPKYFAYVPDTS
ncbi:MAG: restriction endonuclease subunit S, partial [Clostridia bacterium]|nr:restriction endonuclease subunit S [Clostridia bacterium]